MAKVDVLEREIHTKAELQQVLIDEGYANVRVDEYALIEDPHTHPTTGERYSLWGARAQVTVTKDGVDKIWSVNKDNSYETIARASNAVVAYIEMVCCKN